MSDVEATLRLILEVDKEEAQSLTLVQKSSLKDLMHQVNECILFARDYSNHSYCVFRLFNGLSFSLTCVILVKTVGKALIKNYESIIADYIRTLHSLTEQFNNSEHRDIQVVVHRVESQVQDISKCNLIFSILSYLISTSSAWYKSSGAEANAQPIGDYERCWTRS